MESNDSTLPEPDIAEVGAVSDAAIQPAPPLTAMPAAAPAGTPQLKVASVGKLIGAALLDGLLMAVTFGIGWLIWGAITAGEGQTPAKKLMAMRVVDKATGQPLTWARMVFLRGMVGGLVMSAAFTILVGLVLVFMPLWDPLNQSVHGKVSNSVVIDL